MASEELVTTCGATSGLQLVSTVLLEKNGIVFVEDPTYFISSSILAKDLGLKVVPVPMVRDGIDIAALEKAVLKEAEDEINQINNDADSSFKEALNEFSDLPEEEFLNEKTGVIRTGMVTYQIFCS